MPAPVGGVRNWDYRYTWIRDAAYAVFALRRVGFDEEADAFLGWVLDAFEQSGQPRIMYTASTCSGRADVLLSDEEIAERWAAHTPPPLENQTPWQEIYRSTVGHLDTGGCLELAVAYQDLVHTKGIPRDSH